MCAYELYGGCLLQVTYIGSCQFVTYSLRSIYAWVYKSNKTAHARIAI